MWDGRTMTYKPADGGPAFPRPASIDPTQGTLPDGDRVIPAQDGPSRRDYLAGHILPALLIGAANTPNTPLGLASDDVQARAELLAANAYVYADALIAAGKPPRPVPDYEGGWAGMQRDLRNLALGLRNHRHQIGAVADNATFAATLCRVADALPPNNCPAPEAAAPMASPAAPPRR